jgi:DNA polymerase-1
MWEFYKNHSMPLLDPLYEMGRRGVDVDKKRLRLLKKVYKKGIRRGEEVLVKLAGREVNIKSPKQMKEWLYGAEGLGYKEKKKRVKGVVGGRVTCDEDAVRELLREHPEQRALQVVLKLREWEKISGTYLSMKLGEDGKARTTYNVAGTRTGRLSSGKTPEGEGGNFQNVPPWMRKLFLPAEGHVFVGADLSQAEARVVAYVSGDRKMMEFFEEGRDIHSFVAAMAWGLDEERVKKEHAGLRDVAKRIAHGANYGRSAEGVALEGIELGLARKCMTTYFMAFPGIQAWHRGVQRVLKTTRVLETPFGRKRTFAGRYSPDLLREAYAYVPQSTVGDITNRAVAVLWRQRWEVVFQIHDEVVLQCRLLEVEDAKRELKRALELPVEIGGRVVSIPATPKVADSWGGLK